MNKITILAMGLIGGSLAKSLKENDFASQIVAWGRNDRSLKKAKALGIIDSYTLDLADAVEGADIVVIATPTLIAEKMLQQLQPLISEKTVITDVASVKGNLLKAAKIIFGKVPGNLVLGHPIAGSEQSGIEAAKADLFKNHRVILTPTAETNSDAKVLVESMWRATGALVVEMNVEEHDRVLALTSHLPHVLAYTLVDALANNHDGQDIFRFAAGGFRDFTRIASSDPTMWHDIVLANRKAILSGIDLLSENLDQLRKSIDQKDSQAIMSTFSGAKAARDAFTEMLAKSQRNNESPE